MDKKKSILIIIAVLVIGIGAFVLVSKAPEQQLSNQPASDPLNATYIIEGQPVTLVNGKAETEIAPGSASMKITRYFGNEVRLDLNGDNREDVAFLLTQEMGGSGVFYYVVATLNTENGYIGSQGLFLGDRISPQTTEISRNPSHKGVIVVNYAVRNPGEPFTVQPSLGKSIWLKLNPDSLQFGEVAQNFEGEADPSRMTLQMKAWIWISALYNDGKEIKPKQPGKFSLTFSNSGKFSASTDCNNISGNYTASADSISFSQIISTKMYCEGSEESDFVSLLQNAQKYHFTSRGELIIDLKFDSGSAVFR